MPSMRLLRRARGQSRRREGVSRPGPADRAAGACVVCGSVAQPIAAPVLWPGLVAEWGLSESEAASVDRREGQQCPDCGTALRSAALAAAILRHADWPGTFDAWTSSEAPLSILEINRAGQLTPWLERLGQHRLVEYPGVDMHNLDCPEGSWDLVVHSDTVEHLEDPLGALAECRRVLAPGGALCFTIPIIAARMTRRRDGLPPSYHGTKIDPSYLVITEYGADFWTQAFDAGFTALSIDALQWPDAIALTATA
jgi:SAM-dependent methyltransferase